MKIAFPSIRISKFSGGACPQPPLGISRLQHSKNRLPATFPVETSTSKLIDSTEYLQKYWSSDLQTWHQKYTSQKKQNDTCYIVAMATPLVPVSFSVKPNIPICNLFEWDRGSSWGQTWFPHCLNSPH